MSLLLLIVPLAAALAIVASWIGIDDASDGRQQASGTGLLLASFTGACLGIPTHWFGADPSFTISLSLLGAFLLAGGHTDLRTGCAADISSMPVVLCAAMAGSSPMSWGYAPSTGLLTGLALYMGAQALWMATRDAERAIPPSDLLSLLIPILALGANYAAAAYYVALSLIIVLLMGVPDLKALFQRQEVRDAIRSDGVEGALPEHGIALLAVTYPLLALVAGLSAAVFLGG